MKKSTVINALDEMPKEFDLDNLLEKLIVIEKIDNGLKEEKAGKVLNHESVKKLVKKW